MSSAFVINDLCDPAWSVSWPGYEMVVTVTPNKSGSFAIVCNEYCGIGHHQMVSRMYVK